MENLFTKFIMQTLHWQFSWKLNGINMIQRQWLVYTFLLSKITHRFCYINANPIPLKMQKSGVTAQREAPNIKYCPRNSSKYYYTCFVAGDWDITDAILHTGLLLRTSAMQKKWNVIHGVMTMCHLNHVET